MGTYRRNTIQHQEIIRKLTVALSLYLEGKSCRVFVSPVDIRLKEEIHLTDNEIFSVVQPDIVVVCDKEKIDKKEW